MRIRHLGGVVALCAASAVIAACGSGSAQQASTQPAVTAQRPLQSANASNLDIGRSASQHNEKARQPHVSRGHKQQKSHATPNLIDNDGPQANSNVAPCKLVSLHEAKALTGGAVASTLEEPLGPTCLYAPSLAKGKSKERENITLSVESSSLAQATRDMSKRHRMTIRGHKAYCGQLGTQMLYVQLPGGKVLHVIAPCPIAQRFASTALGRLAA